MLSRRPSIGGQQTPPGLQLQEVDLPDMFDVEIANTQTQLQENHPFFPSGSGAVFGGFGSWIEAAVFGSGKNKDVFRSGCFCFFSSHLTSWVVFWGVWFSAPSQKVQLDVKTCETARPLL